MNNITEKMSVGVLDSGVGGLGCVPAVKEALPMEKIVYFGDTARAPYGVRPPEEIIRMTLEDVEFLASHGCKAVAFACNTISAVASDAVKAAFPELVSVGIIAPGARRVAELYPESRIALIATQATVNNGAYQKILSENAPRTTLFALGVPEFVTAVEAGITEGPEAEAVVRRNLDAFMAEARPDVLILGCTHFPRLADVIASCYPGLELFDPAEAMAAELKAQLEEAGLLSEEKPGADEYFASRETEVFKKYVQALMA